MRILIHGINYSPELTGIGKYSGEMAEWLAASGHEVRVVTAPPYYPQWHIAKGHSNRWHKQQPDNAAGVTVYRCPLWVPSKPSGLKRILHLASFAASSLPIMLLQIFWRPDVVMVIEPPLFCAPQAWLVARLSGGKAWLHIQDFEVDAAFELGLLKGKFLRRLVAAGEHLLLTHFDRVSTISQRMLKRALSKGVATDNVVLFPNWVDLFGFDARLTDGMVNKTANTYRSELGIADDAIVALYSGNMGGKQGLEILAETARLQLINDTDSARSASNTTVKKPKVEFVFCGDGAGRLDLMALCEGLTNVRFVDLQPLARLGEFLSMADLHLLPQRADAADLVMPSKLTGMLASARPVIATAHIGTELADVVARCGLVVIPENAQALVNAINQLAEDAQLRELLGTAGRVYAEANLNKDAVLAKLEVNLVNTVLGDRFKDAVIANLEDNLVNTVLGDRFKTADTRTEF
jgi:colanic acid biosynthesis glycosyl transferase WcaI